jgi:hypothetical protein
MMPLASKAAGLIFGVFVLGLVALGLVVLGIFLFRFFTLLNPAVATALVAALAGVLGIVIGKVWERRTEVEAHFRQKKTDQYDELLTILYSFFSDELPMRDEVTKQMRNWQRKLILFAGPKTVHTYVNWNENLKRGNPTLRSMLLMEDFFRSLRSDLGISNFGIEKGDFIRLILQNGDFFMAMANQNPDMTLAELAEREKRSKSAGISQTP